MADLGICERGDAESGMVFIGILIVDDTGIRLKLLCKQQHRHIEMKLAKRMTFVCTSSGILLTVTEKLRLDEHQFKPG